VPNASRRPSPAAPPDQPDFAGFPRAGLDFLREVAARQDRAWVAEHKSDYEAQVRRPLAALLVALTGACAEAGLPLQGDPKRSLFRLHRDVRFSADKRPFQTHASGVLTRTGEKRAPGVLYVHVAPSDSAMGGLAGSFAAAGFYHPEPPQLARLREAIVARPVAWARVERTLADAGLEPDDADALVRLPRGFEQAQPRLHAPLRRRSHVVLRPLTPAEVADPALPATLAAFAAAAAPLLRFGWAALDAADPAQPVTPRRTSPRVRNGARAR
jgi:uncharacterized protein (TIGR02453 family)